MTTKASILDRSRTKLEEIVSDNRLYDLEVSVLVKTLTPEEAIGTPGRRDFPILVGKERMIEARVMDSSAQAFTDSPGEFVGALEEILELPLKTNRDRALYTAVQNAVLKHLGLVEKTLHCRDGDPEECAAEIARQIARGRRRPKVGLIGLNPAIAERLVDTFGLPGVMITDLNPDNLGSVKFGVSIRDGASAGEELIRWCDIALVTGTTIVNGSLDRIIEYAGRQGKEYLIYGVTCAGVCALLGLPRICPYGRD